MPQQSEKSSALRFRKLQDSSQVERPILMSAPMVRATLAKTKWQTRRVAKGVNFVSSGGAPLNFTDDDIKAVSCPYGQPGDRLWVREAWMPDPPCDGTWGYTAWAGSRIGQIAAVPERFQHPAFCNYRASWLHGTDGLRWTPGIHMPRWASRITLEITDVRVERLQGISEADAIAEGCTATPFPGPWWQGYKRMPDGELVHQQAIGETAPEWMVEPKRMRELTHLNRSAVDAYRLLWEQINGSGSWDANPLVWCVSFSPVEMKGQTP